MRANIQKIHYSSCILLVILVLFVACSSKEQQVVVESPQQVLSPVPSELPQQSAKQGDAMPELSVQDINKPQVVDVLIKDYAYIPEIITIRAGDTVRWINKDIAPHTATGDGFDTGLIVTGASKTFTFDKSGRYEYICTYHPKMHGVVVVK
ncbi:MAG: cupredoxin family copper-binding protein [Nanoarchaeota archaeon]